MATFFTVKQLKLALVLVLLALVPARSFAAVMDTGCAMDGRIGTHHGHKAHAEHGPTQIHVEGQDAHPDSQFDCSCCAEHCAGASVAVSWLPPDVAPATTSDRPIAAVILRLGFVPDEPQPPPLAS